MANFFDQFDAAPAKTSTPADFTVAYTPVAERIGKAIGVDPKIVLGQLGLETGWGKSIIPGTNNLGNIKDFAGGGVGATDNMTGSKDKYRAYESPEAFADDYVSLIQRKYPGAMNAGGDASKFTAGLKGYAEDPRYPTKVAAAAKMAGAAPTSPVVAAIGKAVNAVIPSANAAEPNFFDQFDAPAASAPAVPVAPASPTLADKAKTVATDYGQGLVRGAAGIGNTIINAGTAAGAKAIPTNKDVQWMLPPELRRAEPGVSALVTGQQPMSDAQKQNAERQRGLNAYDEQAPKSLAYGAGKLTSEIAGTAGVGGAIAAPLRAVAPAVSMAAPAVGNALSKFATAVGSGGMTVGGAPAATMAQGAGNMLARVAGGAVSGGASAGLVDPSTAGTGALIGGAFPIATKAAGMIGSGIGRAISGKAMAPEVKQLADRAAQLGIDIPADRLVNSKPLNALAGSLDYVPFSGRTATLDKMQDQLNTALSKTFGQNSDNVTAALRKAQGDLGSKFDQVLKSNTVKVDQQFMTDLADAANMASKELGTDGAKIISNQVDEIIAKAANGDIEGQAAYNIKKTLDRISQRNSPEAYYARDLKSKLMAALDRSLGPQQAADFALVRKQYGNMLSLENLAQNGAEGNISIARLANMKNINNPELQELADISAQFLKPREGAHGSAQRAFLGTGALITGGATGTLPAMATGIAAGRGANSLLNSSVMKNAVMGNPQSNRLLQFAGNPDAQQLIYRAAPVVGSQ
jgi:flagellum-specific peptidoglycan hydrolase FlgJ